MKAIEAIFRQECLKHAEDATAWLVFSDWLEEDGQLALAAAYRSRCFRNTVGMELVLVPAGSFWMGGGGGKPGKQQVVIERDFYLGVYPVTQQQWRLVMKDTAIANPSWFSRTGDGKDQVKDIADTDLDQFPVEQVSWDDTQEFIKRLNELERESGWMYRLPTEAQWEYSCRRGASSKDESSFHFYSEQPSNALSSTQANFDGNYPAGSAAKGPYLQRTTKVGSYQPNRLGLFDMHGNVWEWCQDILQGSQRVIRGGSWLNDAVNCRAGYRFGLEPAYQVQRPRLAAGPSSVRFLSQFRGAEPEAEVEGR